MTSTFEQVDEAQQRLLLEKLKKMQRILNLSLRNVDAFLNKPGSERWLVAGLASEDATCVAEEHTPAAVLIHKCLSILKIKGGAGLAVIRHEEGTFETRIILDNRERRASPGSEILVREKELLQDAKLGFLSMLWISELCRMTRNAARTSELLRQYAADHPF